MAKSPLISIRKIGEASIVWLSTQKLHGQIVPLRGRIFGQLNCTWSVGSCDSQWQIVWSNCWIIAESFYVNDWLIWLLFLATWSTCRLQMASAHSCSSWGLQPIWLWNAMKLERLHTSSHVMSCHVMSGSLWELKTSTNCSHGPFCKRHIFPYWENYVQVLRIFRKAALSSTPTAVASTLPLALAVFDDWNRQRKYCTTESHQVKRLRTQNIRNRIIWDIDSWLNQGESTQNEKCHEFHFIISFKSLPTLSQLSKKKRHFKLWHPPSIRPFVLCLCLWDFPGPPRQLLRCRCCQSPRSPGRRRRPIRLWLDRLVWWYGLNQSMCFTLW